MLLYMSDLVCHDTKVKFEQHRKQACTGITCKQLATFREGEAPFEVLPVLVDDEVAIFLIHLQQATVIVTDVAENAYACLPTRRCNSYAMNSIYYLMQQSICSGIATLAHQVCWPSSGAKNTIYEFT